MANSFVLDASVTIRWALQNGLVAGRVYADLVLDSLDGASAIVPAF